MTEPLNPENRAWLIYGATGVTGRMVLAAALERGQRPILGGRDRAALRKLAEPLGLEWAAVRLDQRAELEALLRRSSRVLLTAGPFRNTTGPMLDACLATGTPYVDVSGELDVVAATLERDADARRAGVSIIAAAGFGVTAGDCIAAYVAARRPAARQLRIGVNAQNGTRSAGAILSTLDVLAAGGAWIAGGRLQRGPAARQRFGLLLDGRRQTFVAAPVADLLGAQRTTKIADIVAGVPASPLVAVLLGWLAPLLGWLARRAALRRFVERRARRPGPEPETAAPAAALRSYVWAEASDEHGSTAAILEMGEGYRFAANAMVHAAESLERCRPGAFTPAAAFGADFVLELEGVSRRDLTPARAETLLAHKGGAA